MTFEPRWASPPGDTISRLAATCRISTYDLAGRIGVDDDVFAGVMDGRVAIDENLAAVLSVELGSSPQFWVDRYRQYQSDKKRLAIASSVPSAEDWSRSFPLSAMRELGWIPKGSRGNHLVADVLGFFGVDTIESWNSRYSGGIGQVAFRTSFAFENDELATLAWLRAGELQVDQKVLPKFSPAAFRRSLQSIKRICAYKHPNIFFPKLQKICADCGIVLVSSKAPKGCRASGATWTNFSGNPVILVSFRYLSEDHFWFTLFHEAGHILLHGTDHISVDGSDPSPFGQSNHEDEADSFARDVLVPPELRDELKNSIPTRPNVRAIAKRAGVTPGIVVGQMQKYGALQPHQFNDLKRRYKWSDGNILPILSQPRK